MTRAGIVTFTGKPNAGKSTLMNRIVGEKLSITSVKPQTTRDRVVGILTSDDTQMVILDTPGLLDPAYELQESMKQTALRAIDDADVIVHVIDATDGEQQSLESAAALKRPPKAPVITALNKSDKLATRSPGTKPSANGDGSVGGRILVSALTGDGVPQLIAEIAKHLPESPFLYPDDEISSLPVRFFVAEMVRETALEQLRDEIPYSIACEVEEFKEDRSPKFIRAVIYVERESQKGIVVGAKGAAIRKIGERARGKIEKFVGGKVYLELQVKVLPNWRRDPAALSRFGYQTAKGKN